MRTTSKIAYTKPLPEPQTQINPDRLQQSVCATPMFAPRGEKPYEGCQKNKRKAGQEDYFFHFLSSLFLVIKTKPIIKDATDKAVPNPYMSNLLSPKSLKNDDTTTPVRMYLDTSIK